MAFAHSVYSEVSGRHDTKLATVLMTPFAAVALLYLVRLIVLVVWQDEQAVVMLTAAIVLGVGVNALAFLFTLAHLRNNQDAQALELARRQAEAASEAKSGFLRTMSHELRTPLNAIIGFSELIRNDRGAGDIARFRTNAEHIHTSGRYLLEMIEDLLDLTTVASGNAQLQEDRLDVAETIVEVVHLVEGRAVERGQNLWFVQPSGTVTLIADRRRLIQALVNLVTNAVKFTAEGGEITISCQPAEDGALDLCVRDTGIGMSPEEIEIALTPFGQANRRMFGPVDGIGVGLPLARELVQMHGGELLVESEPGIGTMTRIRMPAWRVEAMSLAPVAELDEAVA